MSVYVAAHSQGYATAHDLTVLVGPDEMPIDDLLKIAESMITVNGTRQEITRVQALTYAQQAPGCIYTGETDDDREMAILDRQMDDELGYEVNVPAKPSVILDRAEQHMRTRLAELQS